MENGRDGLTRRAALAAACGTLAGLAGCVDTLRNLGSQGSDDWGQYRGGSRNQGRAGDGPGDELDEAWEWVLEIPDTAEIPKFRLSSPVAANGNVFLSAYGKWKANDEFEKRGYVVALDAEDGDRLWRTELSREYPVAPVVAGDTVVAAGKTTLHALSAEDGTERWTTELDGEVTGPLAAAGETLFVPASTLVSVSADDGRVNWRYDVTRDDVRRETPYPPAIGDDKVYLPLGSELHAISQDGGEAAWVETVGQEMPGVDMKGNVYPPVLQGGTLYVSSGGILYKDRGNLAAIDPASGEEQWRFEPDVDPGSVAGPYGCPAVMDGQVYVTGTEERTGTIWSLDAETGDPVDDDQIPDYVGFHVVEGDERLYGAGANSVWMASSDSDVEEDTEIDTPLLKPPALIDGLLVTTTEDGSLVAFGD